MKSITELHNKHTGATVCIFGSGPSLREFDFDRMETFRFVTIAVNQTIKHIRATYWFISTFTQRLLECFSFLDINKTAILISAQRSGWFKSNPLGRAGLTWPHYTYKYIGTMGCPSLFAKTRLANALYVSSTALFGAIDFCMFCGAAKVFLFGADATKNETGEHYFDPQWAPEGKGKNFIIENGKKTYPLFERMKRVATEAKKYLWYDLDIINVSTISKYECFPKWSHGQFWNYAEKNEK